MGGGEEGRGLKPHPSLKGRETASEHRAAGILCTLVALRILALALGPLWPVRSYQELGHPSPRNPNYTCHHQQAAARREAEVRGTEHPRSGTLDALPWLIPNAICCKLCHGRLLTKFLGLQSIKKKKGSPSVTKCIFPPAFK